MSPGSGCTWAGERQPFECVDQVSVLVGILWAHNPKVAGSNPAPATNTAPRKSITSGVLVFSPLRIHPASIQERAANKAWGHESASQQVACAGCGRPVHKNTLLMINGRAVGCAARSNRPPLFQEAQHLCVFDPIRPERLA